MGPLACDGGGTFDRALLPRQAVAGPRPPLVEGARVFYRPDGSAVSEEWVRGVLERVQKRAGLAAALGKCHKLRHTFCSRLAMANVPMLAIQKLASHESIETTLRYMHLSTAAQTDGIRALDVRSREGTVETGRTASDTPTNSV